MKIETRHIGGSPATIIELTVSGGGATITEDIVDSKNMVDYDFIQSLRDVADELEEHNQMVANTTEFK